MDVGCIHILPVKALYRTQTAPGAVAVICSSWPVEAARIGVPFWAEQFDDLDREVPGRSLTDEGAGRIARFVKANAHAAQIYVSCDAGESRSAAVAAAICRFHGLTDAHIWNSTRYRPNPLVFVKVCDALGVPMTDEQLDLLVESNYAAGKNRHSGG